MHAGVLDPTYMKSRKYTYDKSLVVGAGHGRTRRVRTEQKKRRKDNRIVLKEM